MSNTLKKYEEMIRKAAAEALLGTGMELLPVNAGACRYVTPADLTDALEIRIGLTCPDGQPAAQIISRQLIPNEAIYGGDEADLINATMHACMQARVAISERLRRIADLVLPLPG